MSGSGFVLRIRVPKQMSWGGRTHDRESFFSWIWQRFGSSGLQGVHEGTVLSEQGAGKGDSTDTWTLDSGEAPRGRDWIGDQSLEQVDLYFEEKKQARFAEKELGKWTGIQVLGVSEVPDEDWDAKWKASFRGVSVPPYWRVLPPWEEPESAAGWNPGASFLLRLNPGAGFGTGTHETTQLCLSFLAESHEMGSIAGQDVLDFGSGSGILAIAAAHLGAKIQGVEIDGLAIENAAENAKLNGVESAIQWHEALPEKPERYSVILANILRPVLIEFAEELTRRLKPGGTLILSGLIASDVETVATAYRSLLPGHALETRELGEWRAIRFYLSV